MKMRNNRYGFFYLLPFVFLFALTGCSQKESRFPSKPISLIVPWDAGGGTDALARSIALQASKEFGQVVNVINRSGGAGAIGHSNGSTARPDGYTMTMITYELCTYEPLGRLRLSPRNFKPVIQLNEDPAAITVHADSPWKTLKEFLDYARDNPEKATIGNSGPGAVWHIGALKLEKLAGVRFTHVPNNGAKPAVTQLLGQHFNAVSVSPAEVLQYVQLGTLRCLGVMSEQRLPELPDVPTFREQGIDLIHGTWRGLAVPPETPDAIVSTLEQGFKRGFDTPAFQETARKALLGLRYRDSKQFAEYLNQESKNVSDLFSGSELVIRSGAHTKLVPGIYAGLFATLCLTLGLRTYRRSSAGKGGQAALSTSVQKTVGKAFLILSLYSILMFIVGYILSTFLYLASMFVLLGERRPKTIGIMSVCIILTVYLVFKSILDIPIPGFWE